MLVVAWRKLLITKGKKIMKKRHGFTIIEVVLVLAIAGLIFLMVFVALPALQRSQRDTQREEDLSRMQTAVNSFMGNNRGRVPTGFGNGDSEWGSCGRKSATPTGFCKRYLLVESQTGSGTVDTFEDPDGTIYEFADGGTGSNPTKSVASITFDHNIYVYTAARCDGESVMAGSGARQLAFIYKLEGGGVACVNN